MFSSATSAAVLRIEQKSEIEGQIQALSDAYQKLYEMDLKVYVPLMMGIFTWLRSNLGLVESAIMSGAAIYFLNVSFKERAKLAADFKNELNKLAVLYKAASEEGYRVTHEKVFLQALDVLSPFIASTRDLLTRDFFERSADVSSEFIAILSKAPHQLPQLMMTAQARQSQSYMSRFWSFFASTQERKSVTPVSMPAQNIYSSSLASAKQYIYGFQTIDQLNQSVSSSHMGILNRVADQLVATSMESDTLKVKNY